MRFLLLFLASTFLGCQHISQPKTLFYCNNKEVNGLRFGDQSYLMAHKGGFTHELAPNSLKTMNASRNKNLFLYEVDVRKTLDGVFVLSHDDELAIDTSCRGGISELHYTKIKDCKYKDGSRIEKLETVLNWISKNEILWLDLKEKFEPQEILRLVSPYIKNKNIVLGLYYKDLEKIYSQFPKQPVYAIPISSESDVKRALGSGIKKENLIGLMGWDQPDWRLYGKVKNQGVMTLFNFSYKRDQSISSPTVYGDYASKGITVINTDNIDLAYDHFCN